MGARGDDELRRDLAGRVELHRRRFLGLMAGGAAAVALGACSDGSSGDRRDGASGGPGSTDPAAPPGAQGIERDPFTLGVASGDPRSASVVLWTRLAPDPVAVDGRGAMADDDVEVMWEVATDADFAAVVASGVEVASPEFGHSVHAVADGLDPDAWYHYRFRLGDHVSPVGRTRTTPEDGAAVDELRIALASCQLRTAGHWGAYEHMAADRPDLVFHLGDYVYEYPAPGDDALSVPLDAEPASLADYRVLYGAYKRDAHLQAAHLAAPWIVTWDDHEVENNYAADTPEKAEDEEGFGARRRAAYQAFWEHHPVRLDPPDDEGLRLHRTVTYGDLATFFVLDGRQYRSDQVCGDNIPTDATKCDQLDDPGLTMLGDEQERWLLDGLADAATTWRVMAQQTVVKALVLGDLVLNVDQWDGYPAARSRLLTALAEGEVDNVMVLTGDIHVGGAADIRAPDAGADGPVVAHELVVPGISSPSLVGALGDAIDPDDFGLVYSNLVDNGYVRCTVTPETWRTEWVVVAANTPTAEPRVDGTVEVTAGRPGLRAV